MKKLLIASLASLAFAPAYAAEEEAESPWSGKVSLGYLATTGNSENTSVNAAAEGSYEEGRWKHTATAIALGSSDDIDTTAEAYQLGWKSDFTLREFDYLFGEVRWQKDKFSGYDQQLSEALGYGRRILNSDTHILNAEIGIGAKQADLRDGTSQNETIALGALDYTWNLSETASFGQNLRVEAGSDNVYLESVSALNAKVLENLALVFSYTIRNNSDVPVGSEKTDTFTAISLEYGF